jgi:hypothetical protein
LFVEPEQKRKNIPSRLNCKTFYGRNLRIFVISKSVCPW